MPGLGPVRPPLDAASQGHATPASDLSISVVVGGVGVCICDLFVFVRYSLYIYSLCLFRSCMYDDVCNWYLHGMLHGWKMLHACDYNLHACMVVSIIGMIFYAIGMTF